MSAKDFSLWLCLAGLWGSSFLAIDVAVRDVDPVTLVAVRMIIGAALLTALIHWRSGGWHLDHAGWCVALIVGATGNVIPFALIGYAEQSVPSGLAAFIMGSAPILTILMASVAIPEEVLTKRRAIGGLVGFAGIAILVGPGAMQGIGASLLPQAALLGAAFCYALTAVLSRRFAQPDPLQLAAGSVVTGAVLAGIWAAAASTTDLASVAPTQWGAMLYLALGPTALAAVIYFDLVPRIGAARIQQVNYVVPLIGAALGWAVLGEVLDPWAWLALPVILAGVFLVTQSHDKALPAIPREGAR